MKKKRKVLKVILWIAIPLIILWILVSVFTNSKRSNDTYELITPTSNDSIVKSSVLTGSIQPRDLVLIKPQMNGILSEILKHPGDHVQVGDLLAKISIVPDMGMVQNALSRVENARIQFQHQKELYEREKLLFEKKISSLEAFQTAETNYKRAESELNSANDALEIAKTGSSNATRKANNTMVRATVSGLILEQPVKVGQSVIMTNNFNQGTTIVSIADLNDLLFVGSVNESEVNNLDVGSKMTVKIGALPGLSIPAVVEYISPKGEEKMGSVMFELKAALKLKESNTKIKAGFSANAETIISKSTGILTIPEKCVSYEDGHPVVYVQTGSGNKAKDFEKRDVTLGESDGVKVEVKSGIDAKVKLRGSQKA